MTELKKVIKLRTVVSASAGMAIATAGYVAGIQVATILVGELAWISILLAGFLCLLSSMCFSELTSLYPSAAGIKLYIQNAFNEKVSIIIGMFYVLLGISMVGAESYLLSSVLSGTFQIFDPFYDKFLWMLFFVLFVSVINIRGVYITGVVQDILTYSMIAFMIGVSLYTFATHDVNISLAMHSPKFTLGNVIQAAAVGVFLFVGYEWVTPLAEETTDYRLIGKGHALVYRTPLRYVCSFHGCHVRGPHARTTGKRHTDSPYCFRHKSFRRMGYGILHDYERPRIRDVVQLRAPQHLAVFLRHGEGQRPAPVLQQAPSGLRDAMGIHSLPLRCSDRHKLRYIVYRKISLHYYDGGGARVLYLCCRGRMRHQTQEKITG